MIAIQPHITIFGIAILWCVALQFSVLMKLFQIFKNNIKLSFFNKKFSFQKYSYLNKSILIILFYLSFFPFLSMNINGFIAIPLCLILIQLTLFDLRYYWLPDRITLPFILAGLCFAWQNNDLFFNSMLGGLAGFLMFQLPRIIFNRILHHETLGLGDVKLAIAMGLWLGIERLPLTISLACILATLYYFLFVKYFKIGDEKIALGVFLCMAFWPVWILFP